MLRVCIVLSFRLTCFQLQGIKNSSQALHTVANHRQLMQTGIFTATDNKLTPQNLGKSPVRVAEIVLNIQMLTLTFRVDYENILFVKAFASIFGSLSFTNEAFLLAAREASRHLHRSTGDIKCSN